MVDTAGRAATAWKEWLPAISTILALMGVLLYGGQLIGKIAEIERRVAQLETKDAGSADLDRRLSRIEGKLDVIASQPAPQPAAAKK